MNAFDVFESLLLGINAYLTYRTCSRGGRCDISVSVFALTVFAYVGSRVQVDVSVVTLVMAFAVLVMLAVISE
jgi:hypothetical protein